MPVPKRKEPPAGDARLWADARDAVDRLELIHAVWRWAGLTGRVPRPDDWRTDRGWPTAQEAEEVFGSWAAMIEESAVATAPVLQLAAREEELSRRAASVERDAAKLPELRRLADAAKEKRDAAETARQEAQAELERVVRERDALRRELDELRAAASREAAAEPEEPARDEELLEEMERALAAHAATERARDELHERIERLRAERERDRRTIDELTRLLAAVDSEPIAAVESAPEAPPATVLEAVERAAVEAKHLRFAPRAFETAADSPFRRPGLVLRTLRALDDLAGRFAAGEMGMSLGQAAAEHGITQWKPDIGDMTRTRYENDYHVTWDGHRLPLGPHIGLGSGSGAQFIARIYLHVSDGGKVPRGITVGVVGRHLPDTTV